jgi:hypothetical protein
MVSVAIFDYGAGNIFSLKNSLEKIGATVDVITNFDDENTYSGLIKAMIKSIKKTPIKKYMKKSIIDSCSFKKGCFFPLTSIISSEENNLLILGSPIITANSIVAIPIN